MSIEIIQDEEWFKRKALQEGDLEVGAGANMLAGSDPQWFEGQSEYINTVGMNLPPTYLSFSVGDLHFSSDRQKVSISLSHGKKQAQIDIAHLQNAVRVLADFHSQNV